MISVMFGSASSASSGPNPNTSSRTDSTRRPLSFLVIVIAVDRKYSSASSKIFSRTPALFDESISSANFSISLAWIWTLAAVNAGLSSPPTPRPAAAWDSDAGAGAMVAAGWATGIAACGVYGVAPGRVAVAGPLPAPPAGGTVWFCLTLSRSPKADYLPVMRVVKWYLASTCLPLTPPAAVTVAQLGSGVLGGEAW